MPILPLSGQCGSGAQGRARALASLLQKRGFRDNRKMSKKLCMQLSLPWSKFQNLSGRPLHQVPSGRELCARVSSPSNPRGGPQRQRDCRRR